MVKFGRSQKFTKENIFKVSEDSALVYKIKGSAGENLYTGIAGRGRGVDRLLEHKEVEKEKIPGGTRFQTASVKNKDVAERIEKIIIRKENPEFNIQKKK